jgi:hypothetical protein
MIEGDVADYTKKYATRFTLQGPILAQNPCVLLARHTLTAVEIHPISLYLSSLLLHKLPYYLNRTSPYP